MRGEGADTSGFAPGKLILSGEHAVVYGHRAVAAAVSLGTTVTLRRRPGPSAIDDSPIADHRLWPALATLLPGKGVGVTIRSTLPVGCGMGSSAALAVATIRALHGVNLPFSTVDELAFGVERVFHGNPSGIDHAVSALGGVLAYRRGQTPESIDLPRPLHLVVVDTGSPGDTAAMVAGVRARGRHDLLDAIGALAERVIAGLAAGDDCGGLFDENQRLLAELGVSTPALDQACAALRRAGAKGAKLAGAGGGGVAFGVVDDAERTLAELRGFRAFALSIYSRSQLPTPAHVMSQSGHS